MVGLLKGFAAQTMATAQSPVMYESLEQGKMVEMETFATLADTCAGGIDLDTITFELCRKYVDEIVRAASTGR